MSEIKDKLLLESQKRNWNLTLNELGEKDFAARTDDFLVEAVCATREIATAVRGFLMGSQLIHKVRITQPLEMPEKPAGSAGASLRYEGSDERGVGTGNE